MDNGGVAIKHDMNSEASIIKIVLLHYPDVQAVYLFGSYGTEDEWPESDVDIALLLSPEKSKKTGPLAKSNLLIALESVLKKDVDIINLRQVSTVLQKEIVSTDRRIYTSDPYATEEFEMLTLSYYQKLNEERAGIIESALKDGRFHQI
jgi:predicted nucleotidyltransferase